MMRTTAEDRLDGFEGLVKATARKYAHQVRREEDDLGQELRVVAWRAIGKFDQRRAARSECLSKPDRQGRTPLERFVFIALTNKIKDYMRDASREQRRQERHGIGFVGVEDMVFDHSDDPLTKQDRLEELFHHIERDDVYGCVDDRFALPAGVTVIECHVLLLLSMELTKTEIVVRLGVTRIEVEGHIEALRAKFADWAPPSTQLKLGGKEAKKKPPALTSTADAVRAEDELVVGRAA